ncbi:Glutathione reductase [Cucumispora dikerogammari]|nr:Glutathione reductase [Cucumispora dikerogammari]
MNDTSHTFDLIVLGAGSGGIACANEAAKRSLKVLLIESNRIGGTCVNVGCVPKKITKNLSSLIKSLNESHYYKMNTSYTLDFEGFVKKREEFITHLNCLYENSLIKNQVTIIKGYGIIVNPNTVSVNNKEYSGKNILISVGSKPRTLNFDHLNTSDDFFKLTEIPKKSIVIGGGYVGLEIGCMLKNMGSEVKFILNRDVFLSGFDIMIQKRVMTEIEKTTTVFKNSAIKTIELKPKVVNTSEIPMNNIETFEGSLKTVVLENENGEIHKEENVDFILEAIGRDVDYNFLHEDVHKLLKYTKRGYLEVNDRFQTAIPNIYAVGDVTGNLMLTPVAVKSGRKLARHLSENSLVSFNEITTAVPSIVFSSPPAASVGITEQEARKIPDVNIEIYSSKFRSLAFALYPQPKEESECKVVVIDGRVKGIHLFGSGCEEVIQGFTLAVYFSIRIEELTDLMPVHPTFSEEVVFVKQE